MTDVGETAKEDIFESMTIRKTFDYVRDSYIEMAQKPDLSPCEIYEFADQFFDKEHTTEKRIFNICVAQMRYACKDNNVRNQWLKYQAAAIFRYIQNDFDYIMGICGTEGKGKSVASLLLANYLQELGMEFDIDKHMFFRGDANKEGFMKVYENLSMNNKTVNIFDEGKAFFDKRDSMNITRKDVLQEVASQRSKNNVMLINVGDISEIDVYFRNRRCRTILMIPDRSIGVGLQNRAIIGMGEDRFRLEYFEYLLRFQRRVDYNAQIQLLIKLPTQYGYGHIPHIPMEDYNSYKAMKDERNSKLSYEEKYKKYLKAAKIEKMKPKYKTFGSD